MKPFKNNCLFLLLLLICLSSGCRKDKSDAPVILIQGPVADSHYSIGDTIHVVADIQDDEGITGLTCALVNGDNIPVLPVVSLPAYNMHIKVDFFYPVSNNEIQTGDYKISVFATDGENDSRASRWVFINELPRILKRVFLAGYESANQVNIYASDSGGIPQLLFQVPGDFTGAEAITRQNQLITAGKFTGHLNAYNASSGAPEWSVQNIATGGAPFFTGLCSDKELVYAGYYEGKITGYNKYGNQQFLAITDVNSYPTKLLSHANRLIAIETFITGGGTNLVIFNNPGGTAIQITPLNKEVEALLPKNNTSIYVIANENGAGSIYTCDLLTAQLELRQTLTNIFIFDAARINEYFLVLATSAGLMEYDYNSNSLVPLVQGLTAQVVKYDDAGNEVYVASGNQLNVYGYQLHNLVSLYNRILPDSILSVNLLYNRENFE